MHSEHTPATSLTDGSIIRNSGVSEQAEAHGVYTAICYDRDGNIKWTDTFDNLVTTGGKNDALDNITNKRYWEYQYADYISPGDPRTVSLNARIDF